jgi:hypothetical protein
VASITVLDNGERQTGKDHAAKIRNLMNGKNGTRKLIQSNGVRMNIGIFLSSQNKRQPKTPRKWQIDGKECI